MKNAAPRPLTDSELLLLGLLAEMPRHGYDLEHEIERRGLRGERSCEKEEHCEPLHA